MRLPPGIRITGKRYDRQARVMVLRVEATSRYLHSLRTYAWAFLSEPER